MGTLPKKCRGVSDCGTAVPHAFGIGKRANEAPPQTDEVYVVVGGLTWFRSVLASGRRAREGHLRFPSLASLSSLGRPLDRALAEKFSSAPQPSAARWPAPGLGDNSEMAPVEPGTGNQFRP